MLVWGIRDDYIIRISSIIDERERACIALTLE
jgi:hypothetical protein